MNTALIPAGLMKPIVNGLVGLPKPLLRLLVGEPARVDGRELDLQCQLIATQFAMPPEMLASVDAMRRNYEVGGAILGHDPDPSVALQPFTIEGPAGPVDCERHRPAALGDESAPALVYYHGGGHVTGSLHTHRRACAQLALEANVVVIAVDYRLAPEHKFPAGVEDALAAFDEIAARAEALGIDRDRIGVGGDSAGGNLSAAVAQERRAAEVAPHFQLLIVPWLDMSGYSASYASCADGFHLTREVMDWYTNHYLADREAQATDPRVSPLLGDVTGVCPAAVVVVGFDPLRDEGLAYAEKLEKAGVPTSVRCFENLIHPFMNFSGRVPAARAGFEEVARLVKDGLRA
ncbi:MAG: alpha/beta hydrolase [Myxococcota bacterium]